jgi:hypothetical protein
MCKPFNKGFGVPTRLIDVGTPPKLVLSEDLTRTPKYATLSHCWGTSHPLITNKSTLQSYRSRIPEESIPQTFRDAITIAQLLDIPYLWIDSLCIVQDDHEDWQREALKMNEAYLGSSLTIAATDAEDSTWGCFGRGDNPSAQMEGFFSVPNHTTNSRTLVQIERRDTRLVGEDSVLSTRGWVLQESILSRRTAHCIYSKFVWQCQSIQTPETGLSQSPHSHFQSIELAKPSDWHKIWCKWIENYSRRQFSFPLDRVAAITGIIKYYEFTTGDVPILGFWERSICEDLLWVRIGGVVQDDGVRAANLPSWSWLSYSSAIKFDFWSFDYQNYDLEILFEDHTTLVGHNIIWTEEPFVSELVSAQLIVRGPVLKLQLSLSEESQTFSPPYFDVGDEVLDFEKSPIPWRCAGQFDNEDARPPATYLCLLLRSSYYEKAVPPRRECFLLLEAVEGAEYEDVYRRVGIARLEGDEGCFKGAPWKTVVLV